MQRAITYPTHFARIAVAAVFVMNVACALEFILRPELYVGGFELSGEVGRVIVQSLGILFLMWNAAYPPVICCPEKQRTLFAVILIQQSIGVIGETWLYFSLDASHTALRTTGLRFMICDGGGLLLMGVAFLILFHRRNP